MPREIMSNSLSSLGYGPWNLKVSVLSDEKHSSGPPVSMNALTLCNHNININSHHHFSASAKPNRPKLFSIHPRNPCTTTRPSSLVIETVEGQVAADSEQTPSSVARRLILLRHAKSSWEDPSLKGSFQNFHLFLLLHFLEI